MGVMINLSHFPTFSKQYSYSLYTDWLFIGGYKEPGEDGPAGGCSPGSYGSSEGPAAGQQQHRGQGRRRRCSAALHGIRVNNNPWRTCTVWTGCYCKGSKHPRCWPLEFGSLDFECFNFCSVIIDWLIAGGDFGGSYFPIHAIISTDLIIVWQSCVSVLFICA